MQDKSKPNGHNSATLIYAGSVHNCMGAEGVKHPLITNNPSLVGEKLCLGPVKYEIAYH